MFKISLKRLYYSKIILFFIAITVLMILMCYGLSSIFKEDSTEYTSSLFQTFTQFSLFFMPIVIIELIHSDYNKGIDTFFVQQGYSSTSYISSKIISNSILALIITSAFALLTISNIKLDIIILLFLNVELGLILTILIGVIFKSRILSYITIYSLVFLGNIINFLEFTNGYFLLADPNSISTAYVFTQYELQPINPFIELSSIPSLHFLIIMYLLEIAIGAIAIVYIYTKRKKQIW